MQKSARKRTYSSSDTKTPWIFSFSVFSALHTFKTIGETRTHICTHTNTHARARVTVGLMSTHRSGFNQTLTHAQIHREKRLFPQKRLPVRNNRRFPPKSRSCVKLFPCKSENGRTGFDSDMHGTELSPKWLRRAKRSQQGKQFSNSTKAKPLLMNIKYAT